MLKIPAVREYFKIDKMVTHKAENLPVKKKGFVEGMKDCEYIEISIFNEKAPVF